MGDDLKTQWGVDAPKPPPSDKQAKAFKAAFGAKVSPIAGHLAYTKAHAEPTAHDPVQKRRDELDTAYQSAAAQIDPSDEAKGKPAIDQTLAQAGTLAGEVAAFRKKIEDEYNAWMKAKPAYDKAVTQVEALEAWDPGPAVKPREEATAIQNTAKDRKYVDALKKHLAWLPVLAPVHDAYLKQKAAMPGYEKAKATLQPKCMEMGAAPEPSEPMKSKATEVNESLKAAGEAEMKKDFLAGVEKLKDVARQLAEFKTMESDPNRKKYLADRPGFDSDVGALGKPPAFLADALKAITDAAKTAGECATNGDYAGGCFSLGTAKTKLGELKTKIAEAAAKKAEFDQALAALDGQLANVRKDQTRALASKKEAILKGFGEAHKAARDGDYADGLTRITALKPLIDQYETERKAQVEEQKKRIADKLPQAKKDVEAIAGLKCESVQAIQAMLGRIEAAGSSGEGMELATRELELLPKLIEQAKVTADIRAELEKAGFDSDDRARELIAKYKNDKKLDDLPVEARNALLKELRAGYESDDDIQAIKDMWSTPTLDPLFNAQDRMVRERIVSALASDPKIQDWRNRWDSMDAAERQKAVEYMAKVPCGKDGWDLGVPTVKPYSKPESDKGKILFGQYVPESDTFTLNTHDDAKGYGFDELMDTITHEIGHKRQVQLIADFNSGKLQPSDPQYQEAAALAGDDWFLKKYPKDFDEAYKTTPSESHSRAMGAEMKGQMGRAFGKDPGKTKKLASETTGTGSAKEYPKTGQRAAPGEEEEDSHPHHHHEGEE